MSEQPAQNGCGEKSPESSATYVKTSESMKRHLDGAEPSAETSPKKVKVDIESPSKDVKVNNERNPNGVVDNESLSNGVKVEKDSPSKNLKIDNGSPPKNVKVDNENRKRTVSDNNDDPQRNATAQGGENAAALEDSDDEMTLDEIVKDAEHNAQLQDDARAVLAAEEENICTYDQGYRDRQALYSCITCRKSPEQPIGVCYACSLNCHDGHDLVELYTKRHFRCDCGNKKCPQGFKCGLCPIKSAVNDENTYNQNFLGTYCTCEKPYPDPEGEDTNDCMVQCNLCEDWFHTRHVSADGQPRTSTDYEEMTCPACLNKHKFLGIYALRLCSEKQKSDNAGNDDCTDDKSKSENDKISLDPEASVCSIADADREKMDDKVTKEAMYWPSAWRSKLCLCKSCREMYSRECVDFLLSAEDPVAAHEAKGAAKTAAEGDPYENFLKKQPITVQNVMVQGYASFRQNLTQFLSGFSSAGKVVTQQDVKEFYDSQRANIPNLVRGTPSHTCK